MVPLSRTAYASITWSSPFGPERAASMGVAAVAPQSDGRTPSRLHPKLSGPPTDRVAGGPVGRSHPSCRPAGLDPSSSEASARLQLRLDAAGLLTPLLQVRRRR